MNEENRKVKYIKLLRLIGALIPLRGKLDFFIRRYLHEKKFLLVPFENGYNICIQPNSFNHSTVNEFIFSGPGYLPESFLFEKVKKTLPDNFNYVDVGSNLGTTILKFYNASANIIGFEPIPHLFRSLQETIRENEFKNVTVINKAVGDEEGFLKMTLSDNSSIISNNHKDYNCITVPATTLDAELQKKEKIHLIKIDVEGFEWQVLRGAKNTLKKYHPQLLIELHPVFLKNYHVNINELLDYLENFGYVVEYYSFLRESRLSKIHRFLLRYLKNRGMKFNSKTEFLADIKRRPFITSYHIYCT